MGLPSVVVYSEADRGSLATQLADQAICIGRAPASDSYLKIERIIAAAELTGTSAIHPGYGFLAENAHFAEVCKDCNLIFIGPSPEAIRTMGNKSAARKAMQAAKVPVVPGSDGNLPNLSAARDCANRLKYPVILKAASGGGGKGMRVVWQESELESAFNNASNEARQSFADASLYMEKYLVNPRHIEIQIMADRRGHVVHLGDRNCSMQRRHQKMVEESPSPGLNVKTRTAMGEAAVKAARAVGYIGAGTIEFLLSSTGEFYFMEMNTRLQVEHPVTEMVTGTDLVREQIRVALGESLSWRQKDIVLNGHSIEVRINAEDPERNFAPCPGKVLFYLQPGGLGVRVDSHLYTGYVIPPNYDSMIGKLIVHAPTREQAISRCHGALNDFIVEGIQTNRDFVQELLEYPEFQDGSYHTSSLDEYLKIRQQKKADAAGQA